MLQGPLMGQIDHTDRAIIAQLQYDGRLPYTTIAKRVGVSEATVRNRVTRLRQEGLLQIVGVVDPHLLELPATAIIGVTVQPPHLEKVAETVAKYDEVSYLVMTSGNYDLIVEVLCRDTDHMASFLNQKLLRVEGVQRSETFFTLRTYKHTYRWGMLPREEDE
jgi:Lrp/AsnC family transcriptional regulator for asnA, asnC and gidA